MIDFCVTCGSKEVIGFMEMESGDYPVCAKHAKSWSSHIKKVMNIESYYKSLEEEVDKKLSEISDKEKQAELLKEGIIRDKKLLKIMKEGLEKMKDRLPKAEDK